MLLLLGVSLVFLLYALKKPEIVHLADYKVLIHVFVFLQIINTCGYAFMIKRDDYEFPVMMLGMCAAAVGWCILNFVPNKQRVGARLYVSGQFSAYLCLLRDVLYVPHNWWADGVVLFYLLLGSRDWLVEHLLFLTFILGHLIFVILVQNQHLHN
jgi:hypothetical protein